MRSLPVITAVALLVFALPTSNVLFAQLYQASWIPYDWIEISEVGLNSGIIQDDQIVGPFAMGEYFPFYGDQYYALRIDSNGYLIFDDQPGPPGPSPIPDPAGPNCAVYPLWLDLYPPGGGSVYYYHDTINESFIVEWENVMSYEWPQTPQKFEVILYFYSGQIDLVYHTLQPPCVNASTVGIENQHGTQALQCTYMDRTG
jgi:hypothetical protein